MRYLPHSKLAIFTRGKEYILQLIVVDESHFVRESRLKHQDAFTAFFDVSDPHDALLSAFAVARHAREPLESAQVLFFVSFVAINSLNHR